MTVETPDLLALAQQGDREAAERILTANSGLIWAHIIRKQSALTHFTFLVISSAH